MTISFTSTYRVPFSQPRITIVTDTPRSFRDLPQKGTSPGRIDILKAIAAKHGGTFPTGRDRAASAKFSVRKKLDSQVQEAIVAAGFRSYQIAPIHNVSQSQLVNALKYEGRFAKLQQKS